MGLALHPLYGTGDSALPGSEVSERRTWIYLMHTADGPVGLENRVMRYRLTERGPEDPTEIVGGIPGNRFHDGGRLAFGPDGYLYVATGDAGEPARSQDLLSRAGKILRVDDSGGIPATNPRGGAAWSWGHRNPQGLAWDDEDRLWSTEHGRSGLRSGMDELNLVEPGLNYGWPEIEGDARSNGLVGPVFHSGPGYTWAPAGLAWAHGRLYFGGLRGAALYEAAIDGDAVVSFRAHMAGELGRIRAVVKGPDGWLYIATSNRDGRGSAGPDDDRILRIDPSALTR